MNIEVIFFTNCHKSSPSIDILKQSIESFYKTWEKLIPFKIYVDSHPYLHKFEKYSENIKKAYGTLIQTSSLSDGYFHAIQSSTADYLFMVEADWTWNKDNLNHNLEQIIAYMDLYRIQHLRFNQRENIVKTWDRKLIECGDSNFPFLRSNNVSNNPHILHRETGLMWIKKGWIKIKPGSHGIEDEHIQNPQTWGAIYGPMNHPAIIHHLNGRESGEDADENFTGRLYENTSDYLTFEKLQKYAYESNSYYWIEGYKYRWRYMSYVIEQMKKLNVVRSAEAGAMGIPLKGDSFLFDYPKFDLDKVPYSFCENEFNIFVALQVWEHLDNQVEAFQEVERISKAAIFSFPYLWKHGDKRHRNITEDTIARWTNHKTPKEVKQIDNRIVYTWVF